MKIGVFDSGLGGLTVLDALLDELPDHDYVYLGDTARAPYGNRPSQEVEGFTIEAVEFLVRQSCNIVIIACNTASSEALRVIQQQVVPAKFPEIKVLGVLIPSAEAVHEKHYQTVGVIGTVGTISSGAYEREIKKINHQTEVIVSACPNLAGLIESGSLDSKEVREELKICLAPIVEGGAEALILGCTHYPLAIKEIEAALPETVDIINSPESIARSFKSYLERHPEIASKISRFGSVQYFTSGSAKDFREQGCKFMKNKMDVVKWVKI
ncbi:glutamate racemase [Candidatus Falkowbacteria bacterium]|nr:glutamate racemase [Candidatus Falkowbacteria bacterium]